LYTITFGILLLVSFVYSLDIQPPSNLKVEYLPSPVIGIDVIKPRFSWTLNHAQRGRTQSAYRIIVSTSNKQSRGDVWDSSWVSSSVFSFIEFNGKPLTSDTTYYWQVQWQDDLQQTSKFSQWAQFDTSLFTPADWKGAQWIGTENKLRYEFSLSSGQISRARLYIIGLGYYEARINGKKVGNNVLGAFTTFEKRVLYDTYDVTDYLSQTNAIGVLLGAGWYNISSTNSGPKSLICLLSVITSDGRKTYITSNSNWKMTQSEIIFDHIYQGETFDATLATPNWDLPNFNQTGWVPVKAAKVPTGVLSSQLIQPIRIADSFTAKKITQPQPGVYVFDFGQNMAGFCTLRVSGPRGTKIQLKHSEMLYENGNIIDMYNNAPQLDTYILSGDSGIETYTPRFTWHGFQYVEVRGYPGVPNENTLEAHFTHSALPEQSQIFTSDSLLNRIQQATRMSSLSNFLNIPSDCPQRERRGWLGDAQIAAETNLHNFDMGQAYTKFSQDIQDSIDYDGKNQPGDTIPWYNYGGLPSDPAWGAATTLLPYWTWKFYGDERIIYNNYRTVKAYILVLQGMTNATTGLLDFSVYGDWAQPNSNWFSQSKSVSTFYYLTELECAIEMAKLQNLTSDVNYFTKIATNVRSAWMKYLYNGDGTFEHGWMTELILPLVSKVIPSSEESKVVTTLIQMITQKYSKHLYTGIVGTKYLFPILSSFNQSQLAFDVMIQDTYPSWGFMIKQGATTLWEHWDDTGSVSIGSRNHIMLGGQGNWYYQVLGGITRKENSLTSGGYMNIQIKPFVPTNLNSTTASLTTLQGRVESTWRKVNIGGLCGSSDYSSKAVTLSCLSGVIKSIKFASYGWPLGSCGNFAVNPLCHSNKSVDIVSSLCVGKSSCTIKADSSVFGDPCSSAYVLPRFLSVQVDGCTYPTFEQSATIPTGTIANVFIPKLTPDQSLIIAENKKVIYLNDEYVTETSGIHTIKDHPDSVQLTVGSGKYFFPSRSAKCMTGNFVSRYC